MRKAMALLSALALSACAYPYTPPALAPITKAAPPATGALAAQEARQPVVILVSIDAFRPDFLDRGVTPVLSGLAAGGVSGPMRPSFPTKTFPNHWTLVTGRVPDRHGIVGNKFVDPARPADTFSVGSEDPFWWNAAEPIWVSAERAGIRTASMLWPGSNVAWGSTIPKNSHDVWAGGIRPQDWTQFNANLTAHQRVATVIDWLRRPASERPRLVTLYFDAVDGAGHAFGPDAPETTAAVAATDAAIGELVQGLAALNQPANLVVVSDHGLAATAKERVIALDAIAPATDYRVVESGPYAAIVPAPGRAASVARTFVRPHPHMTCWPRAAIPARFRYGSNPRIAPVFCLADDGWLAVPTAATAVERGNHGYDNDLPDMRALFIANGPAFAAGRRMATFDNVSVAPLLRDLLGLPPVALDGNDAPFRSVMAKGTR